MKSKKIVFVLLGIIIGIIIIALLFFYGYSSFLIKQIYGEDASTFQAWRNYFGLIFSKVPLINNFVQYEPIEILTAREYFETAYQEYASELDKKLKEIEDRENKLSQKEAEIDKLMEALNAVQKNWREQRLKEEINKVEDTTTLKRLNDIVDTFLNSDAAQLRRLMNAENMSVDTLAIVFSKLPADTRAEMLQELTAVNPQKAADVVEKIGGVDQIISDIENKIQDLETKMRELVYIEAQIINVDGFKKGLSAYLSELNYEEIWNMVEKLSKSPDLVFYILSNVDASTRIRLLKDIKDRNEKLFIDILNLGVNF
ncbi:coiled-coil domain-containing protein [Fervidobacterium sp.]